MTQTAVETFHRHIESCAQCEGQPFNLCIIGAIWIKKAALEAGEVLKRASPPVAGTEKEK